MNFTFKNNNFVRSDKGEFSITMPHRQEDEAYINIQKFDLQVSIKKTWAYPEVYRIKFVHKNNVLHFIVGNKLVLFDLMGCVINGNKCVFLNIIKHCTAKKVYDDQLKYVDEFFENTSINVKPTYEELEYELERLREVNKKFADKLDIINLTSKR